MKKQYFENYITYCFLGKKNGVTTILDYSRDREKTINISELKIEALDDGLKT